MSTPTKSPVPRWVHNSLEPPRIQNTLMVLRKRERSRDAARSVSRTPPRNSSGRIHEAFSTLKSTLVPQTDSLKDFYSVSVGFSPENRSKNRYYQLEAYNRTRVIVSASHSYEFRGGKDNETGRYINADWVRELYGGKWWIATQAPLPTTAHAFLTVLMQPTTRPPHSLLANPDSSSPCRVRTVVQLTPNTEAGREKAHVYFPDRVGESQLIEPEYGCNLPALRVTLDKLEAVTEANCVISTVSITAPQSTQNSVTFRHLLYTAWPDHDVPSVEDRPSLYKFLRLVDRVNKETPGTGISVDFDPPIMVGCSAGIGRTGSFIALSSLFRAYSLLPGSTSPSSPELDLSPPGPLLPESELGRLPRELADDCAAREVDSLRDQRPGMVQRDEQILLLYTALIEAFERL